MYQNEYRNGVRKVGLFSTSAFGFRDSIECGASYAGNKSNFENTSANASSFRAASPKNHFYQTIVPNSTKHVSSVPSKTPQNNHPKWVKRPGNHVKLQSLSVLYGSISGPVSQAQTPAHHRGYSVMSHPHNKVIENEPIYESGPLHGSSITDHMSI